MIGMASSKDFFTHDEIWDDSALVNAWDEALQEYKVGAVRTTSLQKLVTYLPDRESPFANVANNIEVPQH